MTVSDKDLVYLIRMGWTLAPIDEYLVDPLNGNICSSRHATNVQKSRDGQGDEGIAHSGSTIVTYGSTEGGTL